MKKLKQSLSFSGNCALLSVSCYIIILLKDHGPKLNILQVADVTHSLQQPAGKKVGTSFNPILNNGYFLKSNSIIVCGFCFCQMYFSRQSIYKLNHLLIVFRIILVWSQKFIFLLFSVNLSFQIIDVIEKIHFVNHSTYFQDEK